MKLSGKYFCGNEISQYGQENGYLDYGTLARAFDAVLNNGILSIYAEDWEQVSGEYDYDREIFQYFIVSNSGAEILQEIGEILFYNSKLDMYVWGVTHYGTSWDYVLTDVRCNTGEY